VADNSDTRGWMLCLVAVLAGFSERLVPSFANFLESKVPQSEPAKP
jgi:hypothetical protein